MHNYIHIEKHVRKIIAKNRLSIQNEVNINELIKCTREAIKNTSYDFSNSTSIILNQNGKKRFAKQYKKLSTENILNCHVKNVIDKTFKIRYPRRNEITNSLFGILNATIQMADFTIVKFDFKNYFNTISAQYVFEKYIKPKLHNRFDVNLIAEFVNKTKYAYAGLNTSNAIAELAANYFDNNLMQNLASSGIIFFTRYIDDGIIIFNRHIDESIIKNELDKALKITFCDNIKSETRCKTKFNNKKYKYISKRCINSNTQSFEFLGYEFFLSLKDNNIQISYGITKQKQNKYIRKIDKIISLYVNKKSNDYNDVELLRHRILLFTSRVVYVHKKFNNNTWKVKGLISNYRELRYLLEGGLLEKDTEVFFKSMVVDAFKNKNVPLPYFLNGSANSSPNCKSYNLLENMKNNKTFLFVDKIGYDYNSLVKKCKQVHISVTGFDDQKHSYSSLVREYLIKTKIGH